MAVNQTTYQKAVIYFMSGTGNSYRVAMWMHDSCRRRGIRAEVIPIDKAGPCNEVTASPDNLVILVYPTHGFLPPWSTIKFLFKMPVKKRAHVFCAPTRGSFYLGPLLIPGAAGLASLLPALVLPFKGYNIRGVVSLDMPVNIISIHSRLSDKHINRIKGKAKRKAERYSTHLLSGKLIWLTRNNLYESLWIILLLKFWFLFPLLYLVIGRFFMGKLMFANTACINCGLCAQSCPNKAIVMKGRQKPRPFWRYNCEACLRCMNYCPQKAIEVGHSWGVLLFFISSFPLSVSIFQMAANHIPALESIRSYSMVQLFNAVYYYPVILIAYFIFYKMLRWKPFNRLFTYTTFTHIFRRFHDPETGLNDLTNRKS
ncbi:MAG: EFR1 family ferrodoxin [Candidatus Aminicenantales bacterium]